MKSNLELNSRSGIQCPVQASEEPYDKGKRKHLDAGSDKHGDCWIYTVLEYLNTRKGGVPVPDNFIISIILIISGSCLILANPNRKRFGSIWRRLPVQITNMLGPMLRSKVP